MKSTFFLIACLIVNSSAFAQNKLIGSWSCKITPEYTMTLMLKADGSGQLDESPMTYTNTANTLTIKEPTGYLTVYNYSLSGNYLTLSGGDLEGQLMFARNSSSSIKSKIDNSKSNNINTNGSEDYSSNSGKSSEYSSSNSSNSLVEVWEGNGETIEFRNNGTVNYVGQDYQHMVQDNYVSFITSQGNVTFRYAINGKQLTLFGNNQSVNYTRSNAKHAAPSKPGTFPANAIIAPELVGKWCYMSGSTSGGVQTTISSSSQCITIYANGTYEYFYEGGFVSKSSDMNMSTASNNYDKGTWRLAGNTLYVQSQKEGFKVYNLQKVNNKNNDPMIVIDGRSFVTYHQKAPW